MKTLLMILALCLPTAALAQPSMWQTNQQLYQQQQLMEQRQQNAIQQQMLWEMQRQQMQQPLVVPQRPMPFNSFIDGFERGRRMRGY